MEDLKMLFRVALDYKIPVEVRMEARLKLRELGHGEELRKLILESVKTMSVRMRNTLGDDLYFQMEKEILEIARKVTADEKPTLH